MNAQIFGVLRWAGLGLAARRGAQEVMGGWEWGESR